MAMYAYLVVYIKYHDIFMDIKREREREREREEREKAERVYFFKMKKSDIHIK